MALTVTARGTGSSNASTSTITVTPASNLAAGSLAVVCISSDNAGTGGGTANFPGFGAALGGYNPVNATITDSVGNLWRGARLAIYDPGVASDGVENAIYFAPLTTALTTSNTLTITYTINPAVAKCWALWEIVPTSGNLVFLKNSGTVTGSATAAPTITTSQLNSNTAIIGMCGAESADTFVAVGGSWSAQQHTGVGTGATGMSITSQYLITSATGTQVYNPTLTSADTETNYAAFGEAPPNGRGAYFVTSGEAATTVFPMKQIDAGSVGVLCVAADNNGTSGTSFNLPAGPITDGVGNSWTQRVAGIYNISGAGTGVELAIYTSPITTNFTASSTMTLTYALANVTAKAWTFWQMANPTYVTGDKNAGATTASPTVTSTSIATGDVIVAMGAAESADTWVGDSDTSNGNWSIIQSTASGTLTSGMSIVSQYKTTTGAGTQTYNPTLTSADNQLAWIELAPAISGSGKFFQFIKGGI